MKKRQHEQLDEILRHRLERVESPVPDDMWSRIQDARKNKRIHPLGWYYFSTSALLVASLSFWLSIGSSSAELAANLDDTQLVHENKASNQSTTIESTDFIDPVQEESESPFKDQHQEQQTNKSALPQEKSSLLEERINNKSSHSQKDLRLQDQANTIKNQSAKKANSASSLLKETTGDALVNEINVRSRSGHIAGRDQNNGLTTRNVFEGPLDQFKESSDNQPAMELDYRFASADQLSRSGYSQVTSASTRKLPGMSKASKQKSSPSCYSFNSFLRGLSVDIYMAPEYASRQLVYKDPTMVEYAEQRKNDESYVFAYSAGFRVNAHFKGGLAVRTGLVYTDIAEKLQYRDENAQVTKVINVTLDTIYQSGNIVYVWDTLSVTEYGSYNKIGYNRYRFYDIPLMVGYEIDRGNWVIQLNTGVLFNIAASQRGDFLDPDHQLVNFDSNNGQGYKAFRTHVGSSLLMSLGFNYALRPKLHLLVEPQLRVWMQPMNIQSYPVDQKYVNLGLAMGIRQYF